ncbi:peptidase M4 family protein [Stutzerimonas zhaodongensis]|uniref:Neutral metalloproteinase n=1 Tax=Stutzerimonas zhaodongensis TaxID=1176257 RepID=A0A3M2HUC6_9GAMM|nr:M4 family metallopeptidase [Stutzerimonas zhaodongensis]MCQ4316889.1 M4 family metallopeptidase [Stutzerimonas zhaodongensis]RMH92628.1 peptidase M4 family protein [Stutzerimonas zhaodongensis]
MSVRTPHLGFIPPYILSRIIDNGSERQRERALGTLSHVRNLLHNPGPPNRQPIASVLPERGRPGEPRRSIHDAQQQMLLPGVLARIEGQPPVADAAVDEAYDALGRTHAFFWQVFGRDSIDNHGFPLIGTVHYGVGYENAFWNGAQMVFGDGDGEIFNRFTLSLDVVAHELAHGITESEAGLVYFNQSGALNESVSDVFGVLVRQFSLRQTADQADWLIGAELLTDKVQGSAMRSMANPGTAYDDPLLGKDPQPGHMRDFIDTRDDNGGVHLNSGIPNRAFYLAATAMGGYAWERAGHIWYDTLCDRRLANDSDFAAFARLTVVNAATRFGQGSGEALAVEQAWADVGVTLEAL